MVDGDVVYIRIGYCGLAGPPVKRPQPPGDVKSSQVYRVKDSAEHHVDQ